jgi:sec-independent protein translocase protein TatB
VVGRPAVCYEDIAMFNIGPGELIVILILALVLLGPEKLPEMARTVGKGMRELRRATEDLKDQVETEFYKLDVDKPAIKPPEGPRYPKTIPAVLPPAAVASAAPTDPAFPASKSDTQPEASPPTEAPLQEALPQEAPRDPSKTA